MFSPSRNLFYNLVGIIQDGTTINNDSAIILSMLSALALYPLMPRFIISVRELYDRDSRGRWQGIDTGFGVLSQSVASEDGAASTIAFAEVAPAQDQIMQADQEDIDTEAIQLEVVSDGGHQV